MAGGGSCPSQQSRDEPELDAVLMRALSVHRDVIVLTSSIWQTTATAIRSGDEGFLIDSPVLPEELEALPDVLAQAGFPVSGLLATHADWDHLLGRLAFPQAALGLAESSARRLAAEPGGPQRKLGDFDDEHYVERRAALTLAGVQELPVPGHLALGERELVLHPTAGHTSDGMAIWAGWAGVLVSGDYLSGVEIPMISPGGAREAYLDTLGRLEPLVRQAETVIPGHGQPLTAPEAARLLREDTAYLHALGEHGPKAELPSSRRTSEQRRIHARNIEVLSATPRS